MEPIVDRRRALSAHELRYEPIGERFFLGREELALRLKVFLLLRYLMENAGRLLSKVELTRALWPDSHVAPTVLKGCVAELRAALQEDPAAPRYIRSVNRRGYCFFATVVEVGAPPAAAALAVSKGESLGAALIGRGEELAQLRAALSRSQVGARQLCFVIGEAGVGKTTLVDAFVASLPEVVLAVQGQCMEHRGASEAYLPFLEALGQLCRHLGAERARVLLRRHAPTWLGQLPMLLDGLDGDSLRKDTIGATPERMLRELADLLDEVTREATVVLVLEDLHWSDLATLDLLLYLGRRRAAARLLVIGLYRPEEVPPGGRGIDGLVGELGAQKVGRPLLLQGFDEGEVAAYLGARLGAPPELPGLAAAVHQRTAGNPLFVAAIAEELARTAADVEQEPRPLATLARSVPDSLRHLLEHRLRRLDEEAQRVLEAASAIGEIFPAAAVAAALSREAAAVEELCERLALQWRLVEGAGVVTWPDGTVSGVYRFRHAVYRTMLYEQTPPARRVRWHRRLARRLEQAFGLRAHEQAAELAWQFERGEEPAQAIRYLRVLARREAQRCANREAAQVLDRAMGLLPQVTERERAQLHLDLREQRGLLFRSMGDLPTALAECAALGEAAAEAGDQARLVRALLYTADAFSWFDVPRCLAVLEQAQALCLEMADSSMGLQTRGYLGFLRTTRLRWSDEDADACVAAARSLGKGEAGAAAWAGRAAQIMLYRSQYREALVAAREGMGLALEQGDVSGYLSMLNDQASILFHQGEIGRAIELQRGGIELADRNGHALFAALLRTCLAFQCNQIGAYVQGRAQAEPMLAFALEEPRGRGALLEMCRVTLALAACGLGEPRRALDHLLAIPPAEHEALAFTSTRSFAFSECWLALGELERADDEAGRLVELVAASGELNLVALGRRLRARVAMARGQWDAARGEITLALGAVERCEATIAAWRVLGTASHILRQQGQEAEARRHLHRAASELHRIAGGLSGHSELCAAFLAAGEARAILDEEARVSGGQAP